jgi:hypothetical protein
MTYLPEVECVIETESGLAGTSVVHVSDAANTKQYLRVARSDVHRAKGKTYIGIGLVQLDYKDRRALVELPMEADSGARRIWVPFSRFRPQREASA